MGCALSSPVELIRTQRYGGATFRCAVAEMQGWRNGHEDAHDVICRDQAGSFWVLDGHGGDGAALYGAPQLGKEFSDSLAQGKMPSNERIEEGLTGVDQRLRDYFRENTAQQSGSTVVGALATKQSDGTYSLKVINCGDSRGIVVRGIAEKERNPQPVVSKVPQHLRDLQQDPRAVAEGDAAKECAWPLIQESIDHKPSHPTEKARIEAAGGHVTDDEPPRLDGNLAVSRGLGDFEYKSNPKISVAAQKCSCVPDVYELTGLQPGTLCILCCDGVWDVLSGQEVGCHVRDRLIDDPNADLGELAAQIIQMSFDRNSRDNITAMIVQMSAGMEWAEQKPSDEMTCFEKLLNEPLEPEVKQQYMHFLHKCKFPEEPLCCDMCAKWFLDMKQCACKNVNYCSKQCQKKAWKNHKSSCTASGAAAKR